MEHFFFAVKALILHERQFLLIRRTTMAKGHHFMWDLPGGRLEFGETPERAPHREIKEETGLTAEMIRPLSVWTYFKDEATQLIGCTYLCTCAEIGEICLSYEHDAMVWTTFAEIRSFGVIPEIIEDMERWNWEEITGSPGAVRS